MRANIFEHILSRNLIFYPMNRFYPLLLVATFMAAFSACHSPTEFESISQSSIETPINIIGQGYDFFGNGRVKDASLQAALYNEEAIGDIELPKIDHKLAHALRQQLKSLKYKKRRTNQKLGHFDVSHDQLVNTVNIFLNAQKKDGAVPRDELKAHKIKGEDGRGNVHFTGYFTPNLKVSRTQTKEYKYPLYTFPKNWEGQLPTREEIDGQGVLKGKGLELAYAKSKVDIYFMQVQGSGIVEYRDGTQELFAHNGSNRRPYKSIGRYMIKEGITTPEHVSLQFIKKFFIKNPAAVDSILAINESYIFFQPNKSNPKGAGLVPLTSEHSIAVDTRYIPMGSILLAAVPIINKQNKVIRHDYRILVAQDIGGAIKGPGHVDLYTGIGASARRKASALHHYGNLWLLLPNDQNATKPIAMNASKN